MKQLEEVKKKLLNPDDNCLQYRASLVTKSGKHDVLVLLRKKLLGLKVMEIENEIETVLTIELDSIVSLKKDDEQSIMIV